MRGLAELLASGERDFTFHALAAASGVPERTLYRHYAAKEDVFSGFWVWLNNRLTMPKPPKSSEELVEQIPILFAAFEAGEPLVRAMLHHAQGRATRLANAGARRARFTDALHEILVTLDPIGRRRLLASTQVLVSAAGWETMKDYRDITSVEAADAAQWAVRALIAQARQQAMRTRKTSRSGASPRTKRG
jgi:AcrR family transcriptional regulator